MTLTLTLSIKVKIDALKKTGVDALSECQQD
jgi:hypothetical protein